MSTEPLIIFFDLFWTKTTKQQEISYQKESLQPQDFLSVVSSSDAD